jgi:hypothetical protein
VPRGRVVEYFAEHPELPESEAIAEIIRVL